MALFTGANTGWKQILVSNTQLLNVASSTATNTVYTGTVPGNSIGVNGSYWVDILISCPTSANNKTITVNLGGFSILSSVLTTTVSSRNQALIHNRNSLAAQVYGSPAGNVTFFGNSNNVAVTRTLDTSTDLTLTITIANALASESATTGIQAFQFWGIF